LASQVFDEAGKFVGESGGHIEVFRQAQPAV
jgi:hypothetical protein